MRLLVRTSSALTRHDVLHAISYGTLIGALRHNDINPYEVDNDIAVDATTFRVSESLQSDLRQHNLTIFHHGGVYRVCEVNRHSTKGKDILPWSRASGEVCAYTDVYPTQIRHDYFVDYVTKKRFHFPVPLKMERVRIRNVTFPIFPRSVSEEMLRRRYGPS